jgi:hypothetical protein
MQSALTPITHLRVVPAFSPGRLVRAPVCGSSDGRHMRLLTLIPLPAAIGAMVAAVPAALLLRPESAMPQERAAEAPLPAGDAPAFLMASVQPIDAPRAWATIYHAVEQCAGKTGDFDRIHWAVMNAPLEGPKGATFAFTVGQRIVLVRGDTTYLRHEMLHHILQTAGWQPRALEPGEHYAVPDLHPMPLFGLCTGGH